MHYMDNSYLCQFSTFALRFPAQGIMNEQGLNFNSEIQIYIQI